MRFTRNSHFIRNGFTISCEMATCHFVRNGYSISCEMNFQHSNPIFSNNMP
ncbi:hypothetical protein HanRHA438_Chr04g0185801 [Helianthus annuus]|nr:hypothetical protein HanRHA438_Chr04g0185801 [Helianthus annuus]